MEAYEGEGNDAFRGRDGLRVTKHARDPLLPPLIEAAGQSASRTMPTTTARGQDGISEEPGNHRLAARR